MIPEEQKIERMIAVAHMYYEEDMNQNQIAKKLGISRPLVSVLLKEAKACGIVKTTINDININREKITRFLKERLFLKQVILVPDGANDGETNRSVASEAYFKCFSEKNAPKKGNAVHRMLSVTAFPILCWYPRPESNRQRCFRRALLYPFNYGDILNYRVAVGKWTSGSALLKQHF